MRRESLLTCMVQIATSQVRFKVWRVNVGRIPLYLMDTNLPENEELYRDLTMRVYGGDSSTRIMQEILLGVGGVRLLRALGIQPSTFHMNEGHAAFLTLELMREKLAAGATLEEATTRTRQECIFTTHTPVEAGHDRFTSDLIQYAAHKFSSDLGLTHDAFMDLGRVQAGDAQEPFCMTVLALKHSRAANGVSELHGQISRQMWQGLYPDRLVDEVPIGHITNGIHVAGWMKGPLRRFFRSKLGEGWDRDLNSPLFWQRLEDSDFVSDEELWALRANLRRELIEFARRRLLIQSQHLYRENFITYDNLLNPDALTIGFARRFATYKRAPWCSSNSSAWCGWRRINNALSNSFLRVRHIPEMMKASASSSTSYTSASTPSCMGILCSLRIMTFTLLAKWSPVAMCG